MREFKKILYILIAGILYFSCSGTPKTVTETPAGTGKTLLVLNRQEQTLLSYNTSDRSTNSLGAFTTTGLNDIEIEGDFSYIVLSAPFMNPNIDNMLIRYHVKSGGKAVISFPAGSMPYNEAIHNGKIFVTLSASNMVAVVDQQSFNLERLITLTPEGMPYGIAADFNNIYVASSDLFPSYKHSRITVISRSNYQMVTNVPCGRNPISLAVYDGKMYIAGASTNDGTGKAQCMDLSDYSIINIPELYHRTPTYVKCHDKRAFFIESLDGGTGGLFVYDIGAGTVSYILSNLNLEGMAFDGSTLFVTEGYSGTKTYKVNLSDLSVETINGIGGGDCALVQ